MTMYSNKLAVAIKSAGKVLREQKDQVFLPFGTEYSIFIKNLNSVRALVKVELDGKSVTDGEELVVYGNSELNLERFLNKNNMNQGNKFKFIERKASVEKARGGIQVEDGILRVSFKFEKVIPAPIHVPVVYDYYPKYPHWPYYNGPFYNYQYGLSGSIIGSGSGVGIGSSGVVSNCNVSTTMGVASGSAEASSYTLTTSNSDQVVSCNVSAPVGGSVHAFAANACAPTGAQSISGSGVLRSKSVNLNNLSKTVVGDAVVNDAGITAPGSISNQQFQTASWFPTETEEFVIVLKLLGETGSGKVEKAVTVKQKQTCPTCKTRNRGQNKFCRECGSALELVGPSSNRVSIR